MIWALALVLIWALALVPWSPLLPLTALVIWALALVPVPAHCW